MAEDILIRIKAIDEATETIKRVSKNLQQISMPMKNLTTGLEKTQRTIVNTFTPMAQGARTLGETLDVAGLSQRKFTKFARANFLEVQSGGMVMDKLTGQTQTYGQAVKNATIQSRRFKFEWLSIMFAGMALDRAFGGLVRTQMQLFGVTDLMSNAWTIVLLPIMNKITPVLFDLIEAFMNLPDPMKEAIGVFVLVAAGLGSILTVVGQIVLASMGFSMLAFSNGLAGVGTAASGASGKIIGLTKKLGGLAKFAAVGILLKVAYDDLSSKKEIAAIGDALMAAGIFFKGMTWLIPIGVTLKFLGDEEFTVNAIKFFFKLGQIITDLIKVSISAGFGIPINIEDIPSITNFRRAWDKAMEQISIEERDLFGDTPPLFPEETTKSFQDARNELQSLWDEGKIGAKEFSNEVDLLEIEYSEQIGWITKWSEAMDEWKNSSIDDINEVKNSMKNLGPSFHLGISPFNILGLPGFQSGGIVPETGPALLHAGERIIPRNEVNKTPVSNITVSPVYNVTVSDNTEIERMLRDNNYQLVEEIKRLT